MSTWVGQQFSAGQQLNFQNGETHAFQEKDPNFRVPAGDARASWWRVTRCVSSDCLLYALSGAIHMQIHTLNDDSQTHPDWLSQTHDTHERWLLAYTIMRQWLDDSTGAFSIVCSYQRAGAGSESLSNQCARLQGGTHLFITVLSSHSVAIYLGFLCSVRDRVV